MAFALAFAPRKAIAPCLAILFAAATAMSFAPLPASMLEVAFLGCWTSVILTSAAVHLPNGPGSRLAVAMALNAGMWAGAVVSVAGRKSDLMLALPISFLVLAAGWLVATNRGIAVKVVASWLIAVALLAAALPLVPTPGYRPDHME